ncbi:glucan endo- -beta-glucosidase [Fusarium albosuccineum]|uniref:Glucan endo- -beta-glucosidase n=1 Tax=Fusarium albosuccineum TaxID=1237068 RepID=A0A8H4LBV1_9HYPO|nr:glucan endo- -beta-glucosidase [Fusarium albosuccineum]
MRPFIVLAAFLGTALAAPFQTPTSSIFRRHELTSKGFIKANPGGVKDVDVTDDNMLNGTYSKNKTRVLTHRAAEPANLPLKIVNNFSGGNVKAYISGLDSDGTVVFIGADGNLIYPRSGGSLIPVEITENIAIPLPPQGETLDFTLPISMSSGRVYFADGDLHFYMVDIGNGDGLVQPSVTNLQDASAGVNWGFVELTYTNGALYANISYVDFVGIVLGMMLSVKDGSTQSTAGLEADSVTKICNDLIKQKEADGRAWTFMCIANSEGKPVRVLSPGNQYDLEPITFEDYWNSYVDEVWSKYSSQTLTINTQTEAGKVACRVNGDELTCDGDNRGYAKPNTKDIWGCNSGPFAILEGDNGIHTAVVPRLCAAFVRSTLLLDGGDVQPSLGSDSYYKVDPTNHYSRIVHNYEVDGRGYAFPYDDVNPDGNENASGVVSSGQPDVLTVYVGAPPS